uniref:Putative ovule protein n=1 Tax=Solanum chacoense TaxID=4108 RepID=A0A0V0GPL4_SOLCH
MSNHLFPILFGLHQALLKPSIVNPHNYELEHPCISSSYAQIISILLSKSCPPPRSLPLVLYISISNPITPSMTIYPS